MSDVKRNAEHHHFKGDGFVAKQNILPNWLKFGNNMFLLSKIRKRVPTLYVSDHKQ